MTIARAIRLLLFVTLAVYILVLVKYLILDRLAFAGFSSRVINIHPFYSIKQYITNRDHYNFNTWAINLFGNFFMLFPYGILLPLLFVKMRNPYKFIISLLLFNILIEVFQYITILGSFDIDDIILNSSGALLGYIISKSFLTLPFVRRLLLVGQYSTT